MLRIMRELRENYDPIGNNDPEWPFFPSLEIPGENWNRILPECSKKVRNISEKYYL